MTEQIKLLQDFAELENQEAQMVFFWPMPILGTTPDSCI